MAKHLGAVRNIRLTEMRVLGGFKHGSNLASAAVIDLSLSLRRSMK